MGQELCWQFQRWLDIEMFEDNKGVFRMNDKQYKDQKLVGFLRIIIAAVFIDW
jgi:hypothetical protein